MSVYQSKPNPWKPADSLFILKLIVHLYTMAEHAK